MRRTRRGSALLTVLWLSAALAAIAFSLANTVLGETDRTSTEVDGLRCYYLAAGAIHRAYHRGTLGVHRAARKCAAFRRAPTSSIISFPSGNVHVEIIPETAKLDVNAVSVQDLFRLGVALGIEPERAQEIAAAIDDWRRPAPASGSPFDGYYLSLIPSFRASHASIQEIEELLRVRGVTPDIFYGTYVPSDLTDTAGRRAWSPGPGLVDCLSVYGSKDRVDANTARPPCWRPWALTPMPLARLLQRRRLAPAHRRATRTVPAIHRRRRRPPACGRQLHRHLARHRAVAPVQRTALGPQAHRGRTGEIHAHRLRLPHPHSALVRHGLE